MQPRTTRFRSSFSNDGLLTYNGTQYTCRCINGISTSWESFGDVDEYVELDLQAAMKTIALTVKLPSVSYDRRLPKDMKLGVSNTGHIGPWVTAKE